MRHSVSKLLEELLWSHYIHAKQTFSQEGEPLLQIYIFTKYFMIKGTVLSFKSSVTDGLRLNEIYKTAELILNMLKSITTVVCLL